MAVTSVKERMKRAEYEETELGVVAQNVYQVLTNDEDDSSITVLGAGAQALGLPDNGDGYTSGNDTDANLKVVSRIPRRIRPGEWDVIVAYEKLNPSPNFPRVITGTRLVTETVINGVFVGHFDPDGSDVSSDHHPTVANGRMGTDFYTETDPGPPPVYAADTSTRVPCASNMIPYDPPVEARRAITVLMCQWYRAKNTAYDEDWKDYKATVNDDSFQINPNSGAMFDETFAARELFVAGVRSESQRFGLDEYLFMEVELWVQYGGWYHELLDRGLSARADATYGDEDGYSGSAPTSADGRPNTRRLLDSNGNPLQSPVLLDGSGHPLKDQDPKDAIFLRWKEKNDETDFDLAGFFG